MMTAEVKANAAAVSPPELAEALRGVVSAASMIREHEPLARRTTMRVGGRADVWVEPADEQDLSSLLSFVSAKSLPVLVIGRGSNLLVREGGIRGVVLSLTQPNFARVILREGRLHCGAGARLKAVAIEARKHGLAGLEFLEGIPGSVGGALRMNAGAHGGSMFGAVVEVRMLDLQGGVHVIAGHQMAAVYRSCALLKNHVAVEAVLAGHPGQIAVIDQCMKDFNKKRWASQPAAPSAGCVFKNPASIPAGKLVEELGFKGVRVGGAMVSQEHGNFIVTDGSATAADVCRLIERIKEEARLRRGLELETEVQIVGEEEAPS